MGGARKMRHDGGVAGGGGKALGGGGEGGAAERARVVEAEGARLTVVRSARRALRSAEKVKAFYACIHSELARSRFYALFCLLRLLVAFRSRACLAAGQKTGRNGKRRRA